MVFIIGLTGGICSGKTEVAKLFAERGMTVIDADAVAHDVVVPGTKLLEKIVAHFGEDVLDKEGKLHRRRMRSIIFDQPDSRHWLEALLHPAIRQEMLRLSKQSNSPYIIHAIPLLVETLPNPILDRILVVDTPEDIQIQRAIKRDNLTPDEAQKVLISQVSRKERLSHADDVILNDQGHKHLEEEVEKLHQKYLGITQKQAN